MGDHQKNEPVPPASLDQNAGAFRQIIEHHQAVMLVVHPESGQIIDANPAAELFYGFPAETLRSMSIHEIAHVDGEAGRFEVYSSPLRISETDYEFAVVHEASTTSSGNLEQFSILTEDARDGFMVLGLDDRVRFVSPSVQKMLGYASEEVVGRSLLTFIHGEDLGNVLSKLNDVFHKPGIIRDIDFRCRCSDGNWTVLGAVAEQISSPTGPEGVILNLRARDTADRLALSPEVLRCILASIGDGVIVADVNRQILILNPTAQDILGIGAEQLEQNFEFPEAPPIGRALRGEHLDQEEVQLRHPSEDRTLWLSITGRPLLDERGDRIGGVCVFQDVTERKRSEEQFRHYARRLEQSNRELQDFAYVASHDLQEPLRKVQVFGERLRARYAGVLEKQGREYVNRMLAAAERMQSLITDLLSYSRVATRAQPFGPVDLSGVTQDVLEDLETRIEQSRGVVEVDPLPTIEADAVQMRQLLQNLISNALKFHRKGRPPRVKITAWQSDLVEIVVEDDGIGFDEKYLDRIFAPFQRLHPKEAFEGTGVGLAICRRIAERHGGTITARSKPGEGARFVVTLPARRPAADTENSS